ncbi:unnamed protein product [Sympodiomycopsis kandeliae]
MSGDPSSSSASMSMDVRVWYTLDSSPHRMLTPLGRPTTIDVLPSSSSGPQFGKVTLKTCLSAICISSPELILDRSRDYILYVVDPEESYKASIRNNSKKDHQQQQQSSSSSTTTTRNRDPSVRDHTVVVGKGFLGWILEEQGDGDTFVLGKIDLEESPQQRFLDVEIRMKETKAQSREQYFNMLRQFGGQSQQQKGNAVRRERNSSRDSQMQQHRSSSTSTHRNHLQPRHDPRRSSPVASSSPAPTPSQPSQAMQILQLLQLLQARQSNNNNNNSASSPQPQTQNDLLAQALQALNPASSSSSKQPIQNDLLTQALQALNPASATISTPASASAASASSSRPPPPPPPPPMTILKQMPVSSYDAASPQKPESMLQCYNCGVEDTNKATWRLVTLAADQRIQFPRSFECDPDIVDTAGEKQEPPMDSQGLAVANGRTSWRACNRCGLFWTKWKKNRPETLEKKRGTKRKSSSNKISSGETPTAAPLAGSTREDEEERDEIEDSSPPRRSQEPPQSQMYSHHHSIPHQPSSSMHHIDSANGHLMVPSLQPKKKRRIRKSAAMDLVQDKNGVWRSKRSVQENPEGRRPGRPPGCKTGEGQGKSRDQRKKARMILDDAPDSDPLQGSSSSSSSGGDVTIRPKDGMSADKNYHQFMAQSSPLRRSDTRTFPWEVMQSGMTPSSLGGGGESSKGANATKGNFPYAAFNSTPGFSPIRRRYGAPSHILNSSPSTALDALLSEATDFNFDFSHPSAAATLFQTNGHGDSPLRRSPRKNPHGTREQRNPYATSTATANGSPSAMRSSSAAATTPLALDMDLFAAFTNSKSPASNHDPSPRASKQQQQKNGLSSSSVPSSSPPNQDDDDDDEDGDGARRDPLDSSVLTSLTSPSSPSPSRNRFEAKLVQGRRVAGADVTSLSSPTTRSQTRHQLSCSDDEEDDEDDEDAGPDSPSTARKERLGSQRCPGSPSLGQKRKRDANSGVSSSGHDSHVLTKGPTPSPGSLVRHTSLTSPIKPSTPFSTSRRSSKVSPAKSISALLSSASPRKQHSSSSGDVLSSLRASLSPAQKKALFKALSPQNQQITRRKPLPATVEDAPESSPAGVDDYDDDEDEDGYSPYDHETVESFLDMLEDPYGLLAANGIGLNNNGLNSIEINNNTTSNNGLTPTNEGNGSVSIDHFAGGVQLHDRLQFGSHLQQFNQEGSRGVAAYALPTLNESTKTTSGDATTSIEAAGDKENRASGSASKSPVRSPPTTPKKRSSIAGPSSSVGVRSSPRFAKTNDSMGPPKTPSRKSTTAMTTFKGKSPPKTPQSKTNVLSSSTPLLRSPALQRLLQSPNGNFDFSTIFGSGGVLPGTFSPMKTPTNLNNNNGIFNFATPLSPSLSRLLNSSSENDLSLTTTNNGQENEEGSLSSTGESLPAEAIQELQSMLQDPNFAAFFEGIANNNQQQKQQQET